MYMAHVCWLLPLALAADKDMEAQGGPATHPARMARGGYKPRCSSVRLLCHQTSSLHMGFRKHRPWSLAAQSLRGSVDAGQAPVLSRIHICATLELSLAAAQLTRWSAHTGWLSHLSCTGNDGSQGPYRIHGIALGHMAGIWWRGQQLADPEDKAEGSPAAR